eukprot:109383-Chlamydomonas_euryale.AAC.6
MLEHAAAKPPMTKAGSDATETLDSWRELSGGSEGSGAASDGGGAGQIVVSVATASLPLCCAAPRIKSP